MMKIVQYTTSFFLLGFLIISCSEELTKKVETEYSNGKPERVLFINASGITLKEQQFFDNGQLRIEGKYDKEGRRTNMWISCFDDGTLWSECEYLKDQKHGVNRAYYPNGKLRFEGHWENDEQVGTWNTYDESGTLLDSKVFPEK
ncbi:MAG: hypothetical protein KDC83_00100 [Flavobacteriales bacterium]|nr:hypothetical protein [Flavobacteriales bacterium]